MALAKKYRLNLRLHRQQVELSCKKLHSPLFTLLISPQPQPKADEPLAQKTAGTLTSNSRFAILLSKKLAKKAVDRNKIRRKISQAIQNSLPDLLQHHDIILIPKKEITNKTIQQIKTDLLKLLTNSGHSER